MDVTPEPELELSPRTGPDAVGPGRPRRSARTWLTGVVILALLGAAGYVVVRQVQGSSVYYYNVDEAVRERAEIGDRQIRIQGTVVEDPVEDADEVVLFTVAFGGETVDVRHVGPEPPPLFDAGVPSLLEGRFEDDGTFRSERILVKHSEEYREENPDHVEGSPS